MTNTFTKITLLTFSLISLNASDDITKLDDFLSRTTATISYSLKHDEDTSSSSIKTLQPFFQQNNDVFYGTAELSSGTKYNAGAGYRKIINNFIVGANFNLGRDYNSYYDGYKSTTINDTLRLEYIDTRLTAIASYIDTKFDSHSSTGSQNSVTTGKSLSLSYKIPKYEEFQISGNYGKYDISETYTSIFPSITKVDREATSKSIGGSYTYLLTNSTTISLSANRYRYSETIGEEINKNNYFAHLNISLGTRNKSAQNLYYSDDVKDILFN